MIGFHHFAIHKCFLFTWFLYNASTYLLQCTEFFVDRGSCGPVPLQLLRYYRHSLSFDILRSTQQQ